jgi:hypothetical protein
MSDFLNVVVKNHRVWNSLQNQPGMYDYYPVFHFGGLWNHDFEVRARLGTRCKRAPAGGSMHRNGCCSFILQTEEKMY